MSKCNHYHKPEKTFEFHFSGMGYMENWYACCLEKAKQGIREEYHLKKLPNNYYIKEK
jgi:hypothetical protein